MFFSLELCHACLALQCWSNACFSVSAQVPSSLAAVSFLNRERQYEMRQSRSHSTGGGLHQFSEEVLLGTCKLHSLCRAVYHFLAFIAKPTLQFTALCTASRKALNLPHYLGALLSSEPKKAL